MSQGIARVVLDSPLPQLDRLFDYAIPETLASAVVPGVRIRVPVRAARRVMDGWVVEVVTESEFEGKLAEIDALVSPVPVLSAEVWALARRLADRAVGVAADILRLAIPKRQARVEQAWLQQAPEPALRLAALAQGPAEEPLPERAAPNAPVPERGLSERSESKSESKGTPPDITGYPARLGEAVGEGARLVVPAIPEPDAWITTLAELVGPVLAEGRSALVAAPDHEDLDRLETALRAAHGTERVVRVDADQPAAARYRAFLAAGSRTGIVIVGTRSVVYAPAIDLGLIAIWDDGDPAYQEPLAPSVHARDAALVRQELSGCALVLLAHSPSAESERLVEIGWCERIAFSRRRLPRVIPTALQTGGDRLAQQARIPSSAWRAAADAIETGPVLVQVARPGSDAPLGSVRTATELGRAFPRAKVIVSHGGSRISEVGPEPALVVATRGAEPHAPGGYRAVLLLDGERMLARESMRVVEDALRTWSNAIALAAAGAPVYLVGIGGSLATALAQWRQADVIAAELAERQAVRLPPAVRTATLTGSPSAVDAAVEAAGIAGDDVIGPVTEDDGVVRTVIRFDYRRGAEVATALRTELLRHASGRRSAAKDHPPRAVGLRVRMDDAEPFVGERAQAGRMGR
ncbi:MAG TPA: primosomal protein N' [Microbacteriaceae bacterium]|nr:primosomal protein N' [Microbacteriaceae bacterium]